GQLGGVVAIRIAAVAGAPQTRPTVRSITIAQASLVTAIVAGGDSQDTYSLPAYLMGSYYP
ncbi:hypothetical protein, partial [Yersinia mollaretii]|uniref:hypothetical protein n=1 Tax=Yersinia mollaretii TaxID=33060 RepID=UPI0022FE7026